MLLNIFIAAIIVYGAVAIFKGGNALLGGGKGHGMAGRDGKYHLNGKTYDTLEEYSLASWREMERTRLRNIDEMKAIGVYHNKAKDEDELRAKVKEWDEKGL